MALIFDDPAAKAFWSVMVTERGYWDNLVVAYVPEADMMEYADACQLAYQRDQEAALQLARDLDNRCCGYRGTHSRYCGDE